jgi:hypothetical protein
MGSTYTTAFKVNYGANILPIKRLEIFSADEWEMFTEEWLDLKKQQYHEIERFGGAGDQGRDVAAYITDQRLPGYHWDCYQCKHYDRPLMPAQMWVEFGKLIYYTFKKEYPVPEKYYFVSPKGCGTGFTKLLQNADEIRKGLLANWDKLVSDKIIAKTKIVLDQDLTDYIHQFKFSIFDRVQQKTIIEEHKAHGNHLLWFGGGLPDRERLDEAAIPADIKPEETEYVTQLVKAYSTDSPTPYALLLDVPQNSNHFKHFTRARISFHHAEQLRNFSRDNLPIDTYQTFQKEIYDGIINIVESRHDNGFERVKAVESQSTLLPITSNALREVINMKDKTGVCHQLCNDKQLNWVDNE